MALDATVRGILAGAPDLIHTPSLAVGAAQAIQADPTGTLNPQQTAAGLAYAAGQAGIQQGAADIGINGAEDVAAPQGLAAPTKPEQAHHHHGLLDSVVGGIEGDVIHPVTHAIGSAVSTAASAVQKPLADVQRWYRFEHEMYTRHGLDGIMATIAPQASDQKNIDAAWAAVKNGETYRDKFGKAVNPGFDLANVVDHVVNGRDYVPAGWHVDANGVMQRNVDASGHPTGGIDLPTGIFNAVFDLAMDPTLKAGKVGKLLNAEGVVRGGRLVELSTDPAVRERQLADLRAANQPINFTADPNQAVVGQRVLYQGRNVRLLTDFDGNRASNILDIAHNNAGVNDAFQRLANADTETIIKQYPMLRPLAADLGHASTVDEVADVFHQAITVRNFSLASSGLPATGITRRSLAALGKDTQTFQGWASDVLDKLPHPMQTAFNYKPFVLDSRTLQLSGHEFDPEDPAAINGIRNVLLFSQSRKVANQVIANYLETPELGERINILTNAFHTALAAAGADPNSRLMLRWAKDIDFLNKNAIRPIYGLDRHGLPIRGVDPETGEPLSLGLFNNQTGKIAFPDFNELRKAIAEGRSNRDLRKMAFTADDWLYHHYTANVFKNLVLLSVGFGLRVSAGEYMPAILQASAKGFLGSVLMSGSAKLNPTVKDLAEEHPDGLVGAAAKTQHGMGTVVGAEPGISPDEFVVLHRGVSDFTGTEARTADELHALMEEERPHFGPFWTDNEATARHYAGDQGTVVSARFHKSQLRDEDNGFLVRGAGEHVRTIHDGRELPGGDGLVVHATYPVEGAAPLTPGEPTITVRYADGTERRHRGSAVTLLHRPVADADLLASARKLGIRVSGDEIPHYKAAISHAMYGVGRALVDPEYLNQAKFNILTLGGHLTAPGLMSNHDVYSGGAGYTEDLREYMRQAGARVPDKPQRLTDEFTTYDSNDPNHPMFWHFAAQEASKDPGVRAGAEAYLTALDRGAKQAAAHKAFVRADTAWMRSDTDVAQQFRYKMALHGQGPEAYSALRAKAVDGLAYGKNGQLNRDVMEAIAGRREMPNVADLAERDNQLRPLAVKGRVLSDVPHVGNLERLTRWGWRTAIHPTINTLSRAPIYTMKTTEEYKFLKPWVDNGTLSETEARHIAQVRGAQNMLPLIHNTKLRSQMSEVWRNVLPFYFAQEQAYKRYGRVMARDPYAFTKAMLAAHGLYGSGIITTDETGQKHIVLPGGGPFAKLVTVAASGLGLPVMGGVPSVMSGNTISLKSVIPEGTLPSASPLVAVPLKAIQSMFPATEPLIAQALGPVAEQQSTWDEMIPNATLKRVLQATPVLDQESAFTTAYLHSIAWAAHKADDLRAKADALPASDPRKQRLLNQANSIFPDATADPSVRQAALDRIKNSTRILTLVKALVGAVSPLSPSIDTGDVQLRKELNNLIAQHGVANGVQEFTAKHPTATADTVFLSDSKYTGTALPATADALQWVQQNSEWARTHVLAAAYLIPQTASKYNQEAYNQELAMGLRKRKTTDQMVTAIYAAATNTQFFKDLKDYDALKTQHANDPEALRQLKADWNQYTQQLSNANPIWYADLNDSTKQMVAQQAFHGIQQALADPNTPYSPQTAVIAGLVRDYQDYQNLLAAARQGRTNVTASDVEANWKSYLDNEATAQPAAAPFIHGVLRRLP